MFLRWVLFLCFVTAPLIAQTPLSSIKNNNTAACAGTAQSYCAEAFATGASGGWSNLLTLANGNTIQTQPHNPSVTGDWNLSKGRGGPGDLHRLLYNNATTKIVADAQNWFCKTGSLTTSFRGSTQQAFRTCGGHKAVGYDSNDPALQTERVKDMWDRGIDVVALDWPGSTTTCPQTYPTNASTNYDPGTFTLGCNSITTTVQGAMDKFKVAQANYGALDFYVQYDQFGYSNVCKNTLGAGVNNYYQPKCVVNKLERDINVAVSQGYLMRNAPYATFNSKPIFAVFKDGGGLYSQCGSGTSTCYGQNNTPCVSQAACYDLVWSQLRGLLRAGTVFGLDGTGHDNFYLIFQDQGGCQNIASSDGCYAWVKAKSFYSTSQTGSSDGNVTNATQQYSPSTGTCPVPTTDFSGTAKCNLRFFYGALQNPTTRIMPNGSTQLVMGGAYKGFDDYVAGWSLNRVLHQNKGQTWISVWKEMTATSTSNSTTYSEANGFFNGSTAAKQLPFIMISTWDDYEEGTEFETGIQNGMTVSAQLTGNNLTWTVTGSEAGVDHYTIWKSTDGLTGQQVTQLSGQESILPSSPKTIDLSSYGFTNALSFYVQAVGKPSLTNSLSAKLDYLQSYIAMADWPGLGWGCGYIPDYVGNIGSPDGDCSVTPTTVSMTSPGGDGTAVKLDFPSTGTTGYSPYAAANGFPGWSFFDSLKFEYEVWVNLSDPNQDVKLGFQADVAGPSTASGGPKILRLVHRCNFSGNGAHWLLDVGTSNSTAVTCPTFAPNSWHKLVFYGEVFDCAQQVPQNPNCDPIYGTTWRRYTGVSVDGATKQSWLLELPGIDHSNDSRPKDLHAIVILYGNGTHAPYSVYIDQIKVYYDLP